MPGGPELYFENSIGGTELPTVDATYERQVWMGASNTFFHVSFYDLNRNPVTPTGGTVTFTGSVLPGQWQVPSLGGVVQATEAGPNATYTVPRILGPVRNVRMVVNGITGGVNHIQAIIVQTE